MHQHWGSLFEGDLDLFGTCQLSSSPFMFSLQVVFRMLNAINNDKTRYAVFFFFPCQSAVPSDSKVGVPPSSHFQKVLLKLAWGWRERLFFLTYMMCFDKNILPWWVYAKWKMLAVTNSGYFSFCKQGSTLKFSPCNMWVTSSDWGRASVICTLIFHRNVETRAMCRLLGRLKTRDLKAYAGVHSKHMCLSVGTPGPSPAATVASLAMWPWRSHCFTVPWFPLL